MDTDNAQVHDNAAFESEPSDHLDEGEPTSETKTHINEQPENIGNYCENISSVGIGAPNSSEKPNDHETSAADEHPRQSNADLVPETQHKQGHFSILWQNLDYVVESKWYKLSSQRVPILSSLNGVIHSGELTAILGPSGAGKSTLIDCLLGKRERGLRGKTRVVFDDPLIEQERRQRRPLKIATIPQHDHLLDTLTVMETFMFASKIKNAHLTYDDEDKLTEAEVATKARKPFNHFANVQRVIKQLNLSSCASMRCGKLSGGQYKRVSIGQELLSRPDIMILDEPTSGLDSVTCYQTINALRQLIDSTPYPMAIVSTIHQPDVDVFNLFHKAYVLAPGGRTIFEGPTGSIFDTLQLAVDTVESRRKLLSDSSLSIGACKLVSNSPELDSLKQQLQRRTVNPARLIIEVAANEYSYELTSVLDEIQRFQSDQRRIVLPVGQSAKFNATSSSGSGYESDSGKKESSVCSTSQETISPSQADGSTICLDLAQSYASSVTSNPPSRPASQNYKMAVTHQPIGPPEFDYEAHAPWQRKADLDKLLQLTAANMNQRRSCKTYLKHLIYHTNRSWLTILRDPMLFSVQVALHILVPLLISYAFQGRTSEACPYIGPLDVVEETYREGNILDELNQELRNAFENLGYMFFQIYVIIFAAVCVTSLTYPLAMHVLLKEYRNGWYSMSSYFLGRTLADLPVPIFNGTLAMAISYHLTGQPTSPYAWRFLSVATLTVLATITAQTQGLMFGAMLMNAPQAAVFVAPASTAPLVVVSGFLIRIKSLPYILAQLSKLSYFTYLLEGFVVARYGFNRCPCDESDFQLEESRQVPQQARAIIDLWVETFKVDYPSATLNTTDGPNLVGKLVQTISRAKTFGYEMTNCSHVKPFTMLDYGLNDSDLMVSLIALAVMLVGFRWLTYLTLVWKINSAI